MATDLSNWKNFLNGNTAKKSGEKVIITQKTEKKITSAAEIREEASKLGININPLDISEVVENIFKIKIIYKDLGKSASGFLEKIDNQWCIYVNRYESLQRQRFTIAHELGHFLYHNDEYANAVAPMHDQVFFRDENTNHMERQANDFASDLLMPEDIFNQYIQDGINTISALADKFNLSTPAVKYRAYKLGLISEYK